MLKHTLSLSSASSKSFGLPFSCRAEAYEFTELSVRDHCKAHQMRLPEEHTTHSSECSKKTLLANPIQDLQPSPETCSSDSPLLSLAPILCLTRHGRGPSFPEPTKSPRDGQYSASHLSHEVVGRETSGRYADFRGW